VLALFLVMPFTYGRSETLNVVSFEIILSVDLVYAIKIVTVETSAALCLSF